MNDASGQHLLATEVTGCRGSERLFQQLSFTIGPGELVWVRGQNGSGKTTLLRMVAGLSEPEAGSITWNGEPVHRSSRYRSELVYLGHLNGLKDDLTALESLRFLSKLHGTDVTPAQVNDALRRLGIFHRRHLPARVLSQGQKKRVALCRLALASQSGLWVLDEPFDALDDQGIASVSCLLREHLARRGSVLMTSHISLKIEGIRIRELSLEASRLP